MHATALAEAHHLDKPTSSFARGGDLDVDASSIARSIAVIAIASRFGKKVFTALGLSNTFSLRLGESIHIENSYKYSKSTASACSPVSLVGSCFSYGPMPAGVLSVHALITSDRIVSIATAEHLPRQRHWLRRLENDELQRCICMIWSIGGMFWFKLAMIQSEPPTTRNTINRPKASARTLLVLSGSVVM